MKKPLFLILGLLLLVMICRAQSTYVVLALNLVKGETYYNNTSAIANVQQTVDGQKTMVTTSINSRIAFKVTGIRDTLYDMEMRYQALSLKLQLPGNITKAYNSDLVDPGDPVSKIFAAFKNQPVQLVMTKAGNIQSLKGLDAIINRVVDNFLGTTAEQQAQVKSMLQQSFGDRGLRSNFEMGTAVFPAIPVRKGAIWIVNSQLQSSRPANVHSSYELRDITDNFYQIHVNSNIDYLNKNIFEDSNGMPIRYNLDGSMFGDIVIDKITGWVKQSTITQTIGGNMEIKANPKVPAGMVIPMVMRSDVTITGN